jgi:dihydrofolate synthase/folylpolyglutamate synthase
MSYSETIQYLYNLQQYGIKFGLENIRRLSRAFDHPHNSYSSIHVGGTNGKGSTAALIASILKRAGFRVGLFTSPHLVSFTERIMVNGIEITEQEVIGLTDEIRGVVTRNENLSPTFFEVVVMMAFLYFERKQVDVAVFEVGMGGRFDATNIITPLVSVITNIDYDHKEFLGDTLTDIAREKAGIIKARVPVVTSSQEAEAMNVIKQKVSESDAQLFTFGEEFWSFLKQETTSGICFDYHSRNSLEITDIKLPLAGRYQMSNASVAIQAAAIALDRLHFGENQDQGGNIVSVIRDALAEIEWPGRLEMIRESPPTMIDGAHNPAAARALSKVLKIHYLAEYRRLIIIIGIMGDKDAQGIMEPLLPLATDVILTAPQYSRAASPETLKRIAQSLGYFQARTAQTVKDAVAMASETAKDDVSPSLILITGSFYTIGEAKEVVGAKGVLSRLRE